MAKSETSGPIAPKKKYGKFDEWEITNAVDTLIRAEEIKADKAKMKYVGPCLEEKLKETKKAITSIEGLKDEYNSRYGKQDE